MLPHHSLLTILCFKFILGVGKFILWVLQVYSYLFSSSMILDPSRVELTLLLVVYDLWLHCLYNPNNS